MATHEVPQGDRTLRIEGQQLAHASSRQGQAPRWTELTLFRTDSGRYVLAGVGKSAVPGEVDRPWAKVAEGPEGAVDFLYMHDEAGVRFMTRAARAVAEEAARVDADFSSAWRVEVLD
jgi:hypothetical protein